MNYPNAQSDDRRADKVPYKFSYKCKFFKGPKTVDGKPMPKSAPIPIPKRNPSSQLPLPERYRIDTWLEDRQRMNEPEEEMFSFESRLTL